jgi:F0F1-type ATP synthase assembly protein I
MRPATIKLGLLVAAVLLIGLVAGLVIDDRYETRPLATLLCSLVAAHVAVLLVYRRVVAALRAISDAGRGEDSENL